jgi:hypothetical protein
LETVWNFNKYFLLKWRWFHWNFRCFRARMEKIRTAWNNFFHFRVLDYKTDFKIIRWILGASGKILKSIMIFLRIFTLKWSTGFDVLDGSKFKTNWKYFMIWFNTIFMILTFLSSINSFQYNNENMNLAMECFLTVILSLEVGLTIQHGSMKSITIFKNFKTLVRMAALYFFKDDWNWLMDTIINDSPDLFAKSEMIIYQKMVRVIIFSTTAMFLGPSFLFIIWSLVSPSEHSVPFYIHMFGTT